MTDNLHTVRCEHGDITYQLIRKQVKNVNLRIKPNGQIIVSANRRVPVRVIDTFVKEKQEYIRAAQARYIEKREYTKTRQAEYVTEEMRSREYQRTVFQEYIDAIYPMLREYNIPYPELKIRRMTARWGSCHTAKGCITLNSQLILAPSECIEYVVLHELVHFIHPNHSKDFWMCVERFMPDWKERKTMLNQIILEKK